MTDPNIPRWHFYRKVMDAVLADRSASILVVCGGPGDRNLLLDLGFRDVTITNLSPDPGNYAPYRYACEDAENLGFADGSFDFVVVHAGLHHCQSPHRAMLEMYRACRQGILVFEARDSLLVRLASQLGLSNDYETEAVARGNTGMRDTCFPNYIYRWTEREVLKTVSSNAPHLVPRIRFFYGLSIPDWRLGSPIRRALLRILVPFSRILQAALPRQGNLFAFFIVKAPEQAPNLQPWLRLREGRISFDPTWGRSR